MKDKRETSYLYGANAPFIEELYETYLSNPHAVSEDWQQYFDKLQTERSNNDAADVAHGPIITAFAEMAKRGAVRVAAGGEDRRQVSVLQLINAYRFLGNRWAKLDPLKRFEKPAVPELELSHYGFTEGDLNDTFNIGSFSGFSGDRASLREILEAVRQTYCGAIGSEYMYISDIQQKRWIQSRLESVRGAPKLDTDYKKRLLRQLTAAETLERYLHTRYVGQKRFSLEGGEATIVAMDELVHHAGELGVQETVIGMAHRGRLNVLVNTLGKLPKILFEEFEGKSGADLTSGDVKYHMGFSSDVMTPGGPMHLTLSFNPSHLEIINPVVAGSVYARQQRRGEAGMSQVLPIIIHGDAAVAGQGVNQEMLNFSQTRGYGTGGTVHLIVNNQIGFTTSDPRDARTGLYCTEIFKMVEAPIFHVNGDDPEAVAFVTRMAMDFRQEFKKDVVVDIICFRKLGHNEQDEPMVTQPLMYTKIKDHPGSRALYASRLINEGLLDEAGAQKMIDDYREALDRGELIDNETLSNHQNKFIVDWSPYVKKPYTDKCDTRVPKAELARLSEALTTLPEGFELQSRVSKIIDDRRQMGSGKLPLDWGMGENLAYASLVVQGHGIRLSGEDVGRSTFFHRHAVLHDQKRNSWFTGAYVPLQHVRAGQAEFKCFDSVLSEEAVLAFDYGYATAEPNKLVIWEAQFGDFANGAQVVIDQFISSGETKWGRQCGLTMMLPHGYEGQGPEHSSARLERYMQLCAENNMEVTVPSSPAQIFHLLRRQAIRPQRKPLIILTPKSMLRNKDAVSSLEDLSEGTFQTVIPEVDKLDAKKIKRVVVCCGKIYYELMAYRREQGIKDIAVIRLEQLYPFPVVAFAAEIEKYPNAKEVVWTQEEPRNQGGWYWLVSRNHLANTLGNGREMLLVSRPASASPAVGYYAKHNLQQKSVIENAFGKIES